MTQQDARIPTPVPAQGGLTATYSGVPLQVTVTVVDNGGYPITHMDVYRREGTDAYVLIGSSAGPVYIDATVVNGHNYQYKVQATNKIGTGALSDPVQMVPIDGTWLAGAQYCGALVDDGTYIWMGLLTNPAKLVRVLKADPTTRTTYTLAGGEDSCYALAQDSTYVWMGLYTTPAKLVRVLKADPTTRTTYTLAGGEDSCYALAQDSTYVWMGLGTGPAMLVRVAENIL